MAKQTKASKKTSVKQIAITNAKTVLRELNKLPKYRNGVKCGPERREQRYQSLPPYTGHLSFRDVIRVIGKLSSIPTAKSTSKKATRKTVRAK